MNRFKKKKNIKLQGCLLVFFAIICMIAGGGIFAFKHYYNMMDIQINEETSIELETSNAIVEETVESAKEDATEEIKATVEAESSIASTEPDFFANKEISEKAFNIMLVGVDSREDNFDGRTDSMILIHMNPETKKLVTTSFLRDMYLDIPGRGGNRLNAAYVFGGPDLLLKTIDHNFDIESDKYVALNFWLVIDVLNDFGGVDIEITEEEIEVMNNYIKEHNKIQGNEEGTDYLTAEDAGMRHLNGNQVLAYARIRYIGTDFARSARQRQIISICIDKLKHMNVKEMNALLEKYLPCVKTNLTEKDVTTLLFMALGLKDYTRESNVIPMDGTWKDAKINGMSVLQVDCEANAKAWYDTIKE